MAERKQFEKVPATNPELSRLLEASRPATETELHEQRVSFAFGNAPHDSQLITKQTVRDSSERIKLLP